MPAVSGGNQVNPGTITPGGRVLANAVLHNPIVTGNRNQLVCVRGDNMKPVKGDVIKLEV